MCIHTYMTCKSLTCGFPLDVVHYTYVYVYRCAYNFHTVRCRLSGYLHSIPVLCPSCPVGSYDEYSGLPQLFAVCLLRSQSVLYIIVTWVIASTCTYTLITSLLPMAGASKASSHAHVMSSLVSSQVSVSSIPSPLPCPCFRSHQTHVL